MFECKKSYFEDNIIVLKCISDTDIINIKEYIKKDHGTKAVMILDNSFFHEASVDDIRELFNTPEISKINIIGFIDPVTVVRLCSLGDCLSKVWTTVNNLYPIIQSGKTELYRIKLGSEEWDHDDEPHVLSYFDRSMDNVKCYIKEINAYKNAVNEIIGWKLQNDLEKIIAVDTWLQNNTQYLTGRPVETDRGTYETHEIDETYVVDVILKHYGRCADIAFTAAALLNHPDIGVFTRVVSSCDPNHAWNIVRIEEKEYFCDFTRNITRNHSLFPGTLKAKNYSFKYSLLGSNDKKITNHYSDVYETDLIQKDNFDRQSLQTAINDMQTRGIKFSNYNQPFVLQTFTAKKTRNPVLFEIHKSGLQSDIMDARIPDGTECVHILTTTHHTS